MKMRYLSLSFIVITLLNGCATSGNEKLKDQTQLTMQQMIVEGKTTKSDVQTNLGPASTVSFTDAGNEIWTYKYSRATPQAKNFIPIVSLFSRAADVKTKELIVMFDKNNVVSKFTMRELDELIKAGVAE